MERKEIKDIKARLNNIKNTVIDLKKVKSIL